MIRCRIFYAVLLLAAAAFYIFDTGYLSWFLLVIALLYLPLQLLLSLIIWKGIQIQFSPGCSEADKGDELTLIASYRSRLPVSRVIMWVRFENQMTGECQEKKLRFRNGLQEQAVKTQFLCAHCGMVRCSVLRARMVDLAGIFTLKLAVPTPVCFQVLAKEQPFAENLEGIVQADASEGMAIKAGKDGEKSTVREYRIGDSVRDIHWKLTSKLQKPMVREAEMSFDPSVLVAFDFSGPPERMDQILARLRGLTSALLECDYGCMLIWYDVQSAALIKEPVESREDFTEAMHRICSTRLPERAENIRSMLRRSDEPETDYLFVVGPDRVDVPGEMGGGAL